MGRAKLNLEFISKEKSRNVTFQNRKKGLKKKSFEFSTLCGVDTCMIIYGPKQGDHHPVEAEMWPEDSEEVGRIIARYKEHSKEERGRRSCDLSHCLKDRKKKIKYPSWDDRLDEFSDDQLRELVAALEHKLEAVKMRIELLMGKRSCSEDVTGLIDYSTPLSNFNPSSSSSSSCNLSNIYQSLVFDPIAMIAPLTMMKYTDCTQQFIGGCTSNLHNPPLTSPFDYTVEYFNAPRSLPPCYYGSNMQPIPPCLPSTSQIHESDQVREFCNFEDFQMKIHKRERY